MPTVSAFVISVVVLISTRARGFQEAVIAVLTAKEREVLRLVAKGASGERRKYARKMSVATGAATTDPSPPP